MVKSTGRGNVSVNLPLQLGVRYRQKKIKERDTQAPMRKLEFSVPARISNGRQGIRVGIHVQGKRARFHDRWVAV